MSARTKNLKWLAGIVLALAAASAWATPATSYYIYDESGHVVGEYDANGNPIEEHVYLGDRPVAVVQGGASGTVDYVSTDQLNTPRVITDSSKAVMWSMSSDPFGNGTPAGSLADNQPYNLRFPGQYSDAETGYNYNYERDYDPAVGRYIESDPVGLKGGVNTYGYVGQNPIASADPLGLFPIPLWGYWCGPDYTGGYYGKEWNQLTPQQQQNASAPLGPVDLGCEKHDKCYASCRGQFPCNAGDRSACFKNCDSQLYGQVYSVWGLLGYIIGGGQNQVNAWLSWPPGPNAANCPTCNK